MNFKASLMALVLCGSVVVQAAADGGNRTVILGANTFTDMRIERLKNPHLKCMTPDQILAADDTTLLKALGVIP
jgi:hypothetical protein